MKKFTIDGQQMAYLDVGQGPAVLFGHSYLWDSNMWAPQVERLSQHYRCIVPDLWAHGESDFAPQSTRTLQDYAQQVLALLDHLAIEECVIVGLSVGGMWGAELVSLAPQRIKGLVLMDTFVGLEPEVAHNKYFAMLNTIDEQQCVPAVIAEAVVPLFFANQAREVNPQLVENFEQYLLALKGEQASEVARIGRMVFGRRDLIEEVEKFALPTLIAVGQEDKPRPVLESYLMQDCIDGAELVQIPQAGHISNLEQPQFVTDMLHNFLNRIHSN
ncbi:2-succinyl-6-hydroxy-2,4-cyclohexadiene-1-carboxylate synthase [Vibrio panuliri]|uniref:2-succinyl-6-hydroxy-2, 4-cyclohexadiene-1-carboxylate synthase n=1 Tax=Vibrio panuliri TaxID=1381081 RepID=A0A1Q9HLC0_9VIBR|nr:alpha/beta fold hydrolase [Vibrio panuliri]OLQ91280.1 2-succinyl-6-hydroxy-2,4-cyclohexadiene-1-carboxylate synthase [Vibrio panuliri]